MIKEKAKHLKFSNKEFSEIIEKAESCNEALRLMGYVCTTGSSRDAVKKRISELNISTKHWEKNYNYGKDNRKRGIENIFTYCEKILSTSYLRRNVLKYNICEYKCAVCGNDGDWNGEKLVLQLHHKDGDRRNNVPENLEFLCPNCHSQTDNFCGKNSYKEKKDIKNKNSAKSNKIINKAKKEEIQKESILFSRTDNKKITALKLEKMLKKLNGNFSEAGRQIGISANAVKKWCIKYGIPNKSRDYWQKSELYEWTKEEIERIYKTMSINKITKQYKISKEKFNELLVKNEISKKEYSVPIEIEDKKGIKHQFESIGEGARWLRKELDYKNNSLYNSIRKVLVKERGHVFGYKIRYLKNSAAS